MSIHPTIDVAPVRQWLEAFVAAGADRQELLDTLGCTPPALAEPDGRIDLLAHHNMLAQGAEATGIAGFMLLAGVRTTPENLGVVGHLMMNCETLLASGKQIVRYAGLLCQSIKWSVEPLGPDYAVVYQVAQPGLYSRYGAEASMASCLGMLRHLSSTEITPLKVSFQHADPGYGTVYGALFGAEVEFAARQTRLVIRAEDARLPIPHRQPYLLELLQTHARELEKRLQQHATLASQVRALIVKQLAEGQADIERVSAHVAMSRWTLTRKLKQEGVTFNELVKQVRQALAGQYLREQRFSVSEVAFLLGYSETSAFQRAFRGWYDCSPGEYRRSH